MAAFVTPLQFPAAIIKAEVKPNYTPKQNQIADWIKYGHNAQIIRAVEKTRCYITEAFDSHWYYFLKTGYASAGIGEELPDGNFRLQGNKPGGPTTINKSHHCGTVIINYDRNTKKGKRNNKPIND